MAQPVIDKFFLPHPHLQPYVSAYMYTEFDTYGATQIVDLFPVGHSVLSFALGELPVSFQDKHHIQSDFNLIGQLSHYFRLTISGKYKYVYVVFKPFGTYRLLHFPQDELRDNYAGMTDILGKEVSDIYHKITDHKDEPLTIVRMLEEWLLQRLHKATRITMIGAISRACYQIQNGRGNYTVRQICDELGMSKSTIERHFTEKIGINPKLYSRIIRFNLAYQTMKQQSSTDWQEVVHKYNFFDQAHFIKDFKIFFNCTPSEVHKSSVNIGDLLKSES